LVKLGVQTYEQLAELDYILEN